MFRINRRFIIRWLSRLVFAALAATTGKPSYTQGTFNSGSTGADGAFNPTSSMVITVDKPMYNYTSVNIPAGVEITYRRNSTINYPVVILATRNVTIEGQLALETFVGGNPGGGNNHVPAKGGPGGFDGGRGGTIFDTPNGTAGDGPGGGSGGQSIADRSECSVTLPNGVSVITATISVNVQLALGRPLFINGERVNQMEIAATYGRESELIFITESGRRVRNGE